MEEAGEKLKEVMEDSLQMKVPLKVDVETGDNWGDL